MSFMHLSVAQHLHQVDEYESPTRRALSQWVAALQPWFIGQAGDEVAQRAWDVIQAERTRIERFLTEDAMDQMAASEIDTLFRHGIELQVEACDWLGVALGEAQPEACRRAVELLQAGDKLIAQAQDAHRDLSQVHAISF